MAKIAIGSDLSAASQLTNLWTTPTIMAVREFGAIEYDDTLTINVSGAKPICKYDLAPYSMLVDKAGSLPTTTDMRGHAVIGAQREWGAVEYDSTLAFANTPKLVGMSDLSGFSQLVNYTRQSSGAPYLPTTKDKRGSAAKLNKKFSHNLTGSLPPTKDARGTTVLGGYREAGALEYDSSLLVVTTAPTAGENAAAVWNDLMANRILAGTFGLQFGTNLMQLIPAAVWDQLLANIYTSSTIGKLIKDYLNAAVSSRLATTGYTAPPSVGDIDTQLSTTHGANSWEGGVPPTVEEIRTEMDDNSTKLANLDDTITSRLADADYIAPPDITAIDSQLSGAHGAGAWTGSIAPTVDEIDVQLTASHGSGDWTGGIPPTAAAIAGAVWSYAVRVLTQSAVAVTSSALTGAIMIVKRNLTLSSTLTGMIIPATWAKIYLTAKSVIEDDDSDALLQVVVSNPAAGTDGLKYMNGEIVASLTGLSASDANLVVNQGSGTILVTISDEATAQMDKGIYSYDVKCLLADGSSQELAASAPWLVEYSGTKALT